MSEESKSVYMPYYELVRISLDAAQRIGSEIELHHGGLIKLFKEIDALQARIAELEEIDKLRSESVSTLNQANANNEDEIELLEKRIAELEYQLEDWTNNGWAEDYKARIAELEAEKCVLIDQQREAKNHLIDKNLHIDSLYEEGYKLQQRIAEIEAAQRWIPVSERLPEAERKEFCPNCEAETPCTHEAELFVCDICGEDFAKYIVPRKCNVSDVSMTRDVLTDIKTPPFIENNNPDYYKDELSRIIDDNAKFQEMATAKMTKLQAKIDRLKAPPEDE